MQFPGMLIPDVRRQQSQERSYVAREMIALWGH
jgi:hypothetical protein